jgi:hypothetical protein
MVSEDGANTWVSYPLNLPYYNVEYTHLTDDTLLLWTYETTNSTRAISFNGGQTWEKDLIPYIGQIDDNKCYVLDWYFGRISESTDWASTWSDVPSSGMVPRVSLPWVTWLPNFNLHQQGIGIISEQDGPWFTADRGQHWKIAPNVPFYYSHYHWYNFPTALLPGAMKYEMNNGYLYVFSEAKGIWRTPIEPIRTQLPILVLTDSNNETMKDAIGFNVYPNPNNGIFDIETPVNFTGNIVIYNFMGQIMQKIEPNAINTQLSIEKKGQYLVVFEENGVVLSRKKVVVL